MRNNSKRNKRAVSSGVVVKSSARIRGNELLQTTPTSTNSSGLNVNDTYPIQIATSGFLDRISGIAQNYARWKINKLMFHLTPITGSNSPGVIAMAFTDDPTLAAPTSMGALSEHSAFKMVNNTIPVNTLNVSSLLKNKELFCFSSGVGGDTRWYQAGQLFVQTQNYDVALLSYWIRVQYDITLFDPI